MGWRWYLSRNFLMHPALLRLMMLFYIPGTIYGYYWYKNQLIHTWNEHPLWQIVFVPDSPTASLWFTIAMVWRWISPGQPRNPAVKGLRSMVEALAVVTSIQYGIWATAIILWGNAQGVPLDWASWMLMSSHAAMAICAWLYARFFRFGAAALIAAVVLTFLNDAVDYTFGVYPYLPTALHDDVPVICWFTVLLSAFSAMTGAAARWLPADGRRKDSGFSSGRPSR